MAELIQIGNSKGVRIPKTLIEQAGLENGELELKVVRGGLLIKPVRQARQGWGEAVAAALEKGEVVYDRAWLEADLGGDFELLPEP